MADDPGVAGDAGVAGMVFFLGAQAFAFAGPQGAARFFFGAQAFAFAGPHGAAFFVFFGAQGAAAFESWAIAAGAATAAEKATAKAASCWVVFFIRISWG